MKKITILFLLSFSYIARGMEQEKLFFIAYLSSISGEMIIEELTSANITSLKIPQQNAFLRLQQVTQPPFVSFDKFAAYVSLSRKSKPADPIEAKKQKKEIRNNIVDYIFMHHYANDNERQELLDRLANKK